MLTYSLISPPKFSFGRGRKRFFQILVFIFLVVGLGGSVWLAQNPIPGLAKAADNGNGAVNILSSESLKERAQLFSQYDVDRDGFITLPEQISSFLPSGTKNPTALRGYIIQLKTDPVITYQKGLSQTDPSGQKDNLSQLTKDYKRNLLTVHQSVKESIRQRLGKKGILSGKPSDIKSSDNLIVTGEYTNVFNGFALAISVQEAESIKSLPEIKAVYPNFPVKAFLNESVPLINATDLWNIKDVENRDITGKDITIGIIDSGIDYTHSDLGGCSKTSFLGGQCSKVIGGYNFVNSSNDPMDDRYHGTHVAATAAGNGSLKGVAPEAKLVAYKVLDSYGRGSADDIISAIERSSDPNQDGDTSDHLDVINLSLGGPGYPDDPMSQAIDAVADLGVVAVIAAGNSGPDSATIGSPGTSRKAITVGANDKSSVLASFSSRGPVLYKPGSDWDIMKPDIVGPGVNICAAKLFNFVPLTTCRDSQHIPLGGTSMAAPHVAGAAALLIQLHPDWTPQMVKNALMATSTDLGEDAFKQGVGMINSLQAAGASIFVSPASLGFGFVDKSNNQWLVTKRLTIKNIKSNLVNPSPTSIPTSTPGPTSSARRVFVTSNVYDGNLGGLSGADQKCLDSANAASLCGNSQCPAGTWKAWLSTNATGSASRLNHSEVPYKLLNELEIANNWRDLIDENITFPINMDENKDTHSKDALVWTNTEANGNPPSLPQDCQAWAASEEYYQGLTGDTLRTDKAWTRYAIAWCNLKARLYCFEDRDIMLNSSSSAFSSAQVLAESTSSLQITAKVKQTIPGASLTLSQTEFSLAQGETKDIDVTLTVDTSSIVEGSYFNEIEINDGSNTYRIPVAFFQKNLQLDIKPRYSKGNITASLTTPFIHLATTPTLTISSPDGQVSNINLAAEDDIFIDPSNWFASSTLNQEGNYTLTATSSEMPGYSVTANLTIDKTSPNIEVNPSVSTDKKFLNINITPNEQLAPSYSAQFLTNPLSEVLDWYPAAYADSNNIYILFYKSGTINSGVYFIKSNDLGMQWSTPKLLFPIDQTLEAPSLAIIKLNNKLFAVFLSKIVSSSDDGETWSQPQRVTNDTQMIIYAHLRALKVANNKLHLIYVAYTSNYQNQELKYINSSDGVSWSTPKILFTTPQDISFSGVDLAAQDGRLSVVYTYNDTRSENPGKVYYSGSTDGVSWNNPKILESGLYADYPSIALSGNDIFVAWSTNRYGYINMAKSTNGGTSWTTQLDVTHSGNNFDWLPKITFAGDRLSIMWLRGIFGKIQTKVSRDLGQTWGENIDLLVNGVTFNGTLASSEKATHFVWPTGSLGSFSLAYANDVELLTSVTFNGQRQYVEAIKSGNSYIAQYPISSEGRYDINVVASDRAGNLGSINTPYNNYSNYYFGEFLEAFGTRRGDAKYNEKYDYNNDGRISILDWSSLLNKFTPASLQLREGYTPSELISTYNKSSTDSGFNSKYDVNTDKVVNKTDYTILNTITYSPTPSPTANPKASADLIVNKVEVLGTTRLRGRLRHKNSINVTVKNIGTVAVKKVEVGIRIVQPNGSTLGTCSSSSNNIASGKTTIVQMRNCPPFKVAGTHNITATVDPTNLVTETNEGNNQLITTINIQK